MMFNLDVNMMKIVKDREYRIMDEIKSVYDGAVSNGQDLDVYF